MQNMLQSLKQAPLKELQEVYTAAKNIMVDENDIMSPCCYRKSVNDIALYVKNEDSAAKTVIELRKQNGESKIRIKDKEMFILQIAEQASDNLKKVAGIFFEREIKREWPYQTPQIRSVFAGDALMQDTASLKTILDIAESSNVMNRVRVKRDGKLQKVEQLHQKIRQIRDQMLVGNLQSATDYLKSLSAKTNGSYEQEELRAIQEAMFQYGLKLNRLPATALLVIVGVHSAGSQGEVDTEALELFGTASVQIDIKTRLHQVIVNESQQLVKYDSPARIFGTGGAGCCHYAVSYTRGECPMCKDYSTQHTAAIFPQKD